MWRLASVETPWGIRGGSVRSPRRLCQDLGVCCLVWCFSLVFYSCDFCFIWRLHEAVLWRLAFVEDPWGSTEGGLSLVF